MLQCRGTSKFKTQEMLKKEARKSELRVRERGARGRLSAEPEAEAEAAEDASPAVTLERAAAAKRDVVLVLEGATAAEKLRLKITIPESWSGKPAAKLKQTLAKHANAKQPGRGLDPNELAMTREGGGRLRGDAPLDILESGETVTFRVAAKKRAAAGGESFS